MFDDQGQLIMSHGTFETFPKVEGCPAWSDFQFRAPKEPENARSAHIGLGRCARCALSSCRTPPGSSGHGQQTRTGQHLPSRSPACRPPSQAVRLGQEGVFQVIQWPGSVRHPVSGTGGE
ncbi:MAG: hypothetical protein R3E96_15085 [Planctomycetota bacterium]